MNLYRHSGNIKAGLFFLGILLVSGLLIYSQSIVDRLREDNREVVQLYAEIIASTVESESDDNLDFIFDKIIKQVQFPLIYSDVNHQPLDWKNLPAGLASESVKKHQKEMDRQNPPIPLVFTNPADSEQITIGYLHYGDSVLIKRLRWLPYLEIGAVALFILLGFIGFTVIRNSEKRSIWVGMARETAHQLGTPVSALLGWVERLRGTSDAKVISEMDRDLQRLKDVGDRFSKIGSTPKLEDMDVKDVIDAVTEYLRSRIPSRGARVKIISNLSEGFHILGNSILFSWAIENLIKNGIDAMDSGIGQITIDSSLEGSSVILRITDTGKGIPRSDRKNVFRPGFSSKSGGWGLGLSLTQRIIRDIHGGSIRIVDSDINQGTVFEIKLPAVKEELQ